MQASLCPSLAKCGRPDALGEPAAPILEWPAAGLDPVPTEPRIGSSVLLRRRRLDRDAVRSKHYRSSLPITAITEVLARRRLRRLTLNLSHRFAVLWIIAHLKLLHQICYRRKSAFHFDEVVRFPLAIEVGFFRSVEPEQEEPSLVSSRLNEVLFFACDGFWTEIEVVGAIRIWHRVSKGGDAGGRRSIFEDGSGHAVIEG